MFLLWNKPEGWKLLTPVCSELTSRSLLAWEHQWLFFLGGRWSWAAQGEDVRGERVADTAVDAHCSSGLFSFQLITGCGVWLMLSGELQPCSSRWSTVGGRSWGGHGTSDTALWQWSNPCPPARQSFPGQPVLPSLPAFKDLPWAWGLCERPASGFHLFHLKRWAPFLWGMILSEGWCGEAVCVGRIVCKGDAEACLSSKGWQPVDEAELQHCPGNRWFWGMKNS